MRFFIAGGAGFIGSHMTEKFLQDHYVSKVVIFNNFSSAAYSHFFASIII
jgi:nucleoside-diphosphate-sugar epimerase